MKKNWIATLTDPLICSVNGVPSAAAAADVGMSWIPLLFFTVVIGGIGTIEGPIVGTLIYFALRQCFSDFGSWYLIFLGSLAIGVMSWAPRGIWGVLADRFGWRIFPLARRLKVTGGIP
jgi:branched-chain amino acid transport system permease protein